MSYAEDPNPTMTDMIEEEPHHDHRKTTTPDKKKIGGAHLLIGKAGLQKTFRKKKKGLISFD